MCENLLLPRHRAAATVLIPSAIAVLFLSTCAPTPTSGPPVATTAVTTTSPTLLPGESEHALTVNGLARTFLLHVPPGLDSHRPVPVVFVFHGFAENARVARAYTGFDDIADANGFMVIYPNGTGYDSGDLSWNAGGCCGYAVINNVDETAFVRQILMDLSTIASLDPKRNYAAGFANGAMLTYRLACEMSDTFAAVAPVAGALLYYGPCRPLQPVSVIHLHGLSDSSIPYAGGGLAGFGQQYPPAEYGIKTWARLDGCIDSPRAEMDGMLRHTVYDSCRAGTAVELYVIEDLGHAWSQPSEVPGFSATETIWDFFAAHPKP